MMMTGYAQGIGMGESLRWHDGRLWLADWRDGTVLEADDTGALRSVAHVSSFPVTFDWLPDGRLLIVSGSDAKVMAQAEGGTPEVYVDLAPLTPTPWNEVVTDAAGNAYVNGIGYPYGRPAEAVGSIVLIRPDRSIETVATGLAFPNGMAISPDGSTLVVAESNVGRLAAFTITSNATLTPREPWAELAGSAPDGICWDPSGGIWFADVPNHSVTLVRDGGHIARVVELDDGCFSCVVGGDQLYAVTAAWPTAIQDPASRTGRVMVTTLE